MKLIRAAVFALFLTSVLTACTTISMAPPEGGLISKSRSLTILGMTRIRFPEIRGNISAIDVRSLGAGWQTGPFLGWNGSSMITADPGKCQLIIVIRSAVEAANAAKVLEQLKGENLCVADYTKK
jgi:hypothetical protein